MCEACRLVAEAFETAQADPHASYVPTMLLLDELTRQKRLELTAGDCLPQDTAKWLARETHYTICHYFTCTHCGGIYFIGSCVRGTPLYRRCYSLQNQTELRKLWGREGTFFQRRPCDNQQEVPTMNDCLFCKLAAGKIPSEKVYEDDTVLVFKDIAPQAPVHLLAIPKAHIAGVADITAENSAILPHLFQVIAQTAAQAGLEDGYRVVSNVGEHGQQTVPHLHFHIIGGRQLAWPPG